MQGLQERRRRRRALAAHVLIHVVPTAGQGCGNASPVQTNDVIAAMRTASAGDLVPVPEGSLDGDLGAVMAAADTPSPSGLAPAGLSADTTTTMLGRAGINMLKPSPQTARLAYLLLAADLEDPTVTSA